MFGPNLLLGRASFLANFLLGGTKPSQIDSRTNSQRASEPAIRPVASQRRPLVWWDGCPAGLSVRNLIGPSALTIACDHAAVMYCGYHEELERANVHVVWSRPQGRRVVERWVISRTQYVSSEWLERDEVAGRVCECGNPWCCYCIARVCNARTMSKEEARPWCEFERESNSAHVQRCTGSTQGSWSFAMST